MLARYDNKRLGELVRDDGTRATSAQLASDTILQAMLDDAAAMVDSAVRVGERYSTLDLTTTLTGNARLFLVRLNCDLAYGLLLQRRGFPADQLNNLAPGYTAALAQLDLLREGERIFNLTEQADKGSKITPVPNPDNNRGIFRMSQEAAAYFGDLCLPNTPDAFNRGL